MIRFNPRGGLFLGFLLIAAIQGLLISARGWDTAWSYWGVPARSPAFSDLRVITGAADSIERGYDPREANPGAPFRQRFNQTRVWLWLRYLGVHGSTSPVIGAALIAAYLLSLWWLCDGISVVAAWTLLPLAVSPAACLALERGTTDLSVFILVALAAKLVARFPRGSVAGLIAAFVLKLFPLAAMGLLLRRPRGQALRAIAAILLFAALFCFLDFRELVDIAFKTEKGRESSYGWATLGLYLQGHHHFSADASLHVRVAGGILAFGGCAVAIWTGLRSRPPVSESAALDFFRGGMGIYLGTFALGASWDYRLIFLLLTVPLLVSWARTHISGRKGVAQTMIVAVAISLWSLGLDRWFGSNAVGEVVFRSAEEISEWTLFFAGTYLLASTLPPGFMRLGSDAVSPPAG